MKKYLFLTLFLLWTVNLYAAPDSNMTIPSVGDGDTISASEHTTARNTISSTYNAHSHTDITSLSNLSSIGTITTGTWNGTDVAVTAGGTGSSTASGARTNLGLAIGTDIQGIDTQITDIAGLTPTDNGVIIGNGSNFVVEEGATLKTSLGLTIGTNVQAYDADLTTWAGITPGTGVGTFLATPSSANLLAAVTDETGTGPLVFGYSPTISGGTITGITDLVVADGGTGVSTLGDAGVLIGNGTGAIQATAAGTAGQVLTSNGAGVDPTFQAQAGETLI